MSTVLVQFESYLNVAIVYKGAVSTVRARNVTTKTPSPSQLTPCCREKLHISYS